MQNNPFDVTSRTSMLSRRQFMGCVALAGATLALGQNVAGAAPVARRPNFLVILADDMGFSDAGCYGGDIATPNLDRLASNGLRFTQFYSTGRCWPSRTGLLTGYYAQQVHMDPQEGRLPRWARVMPHYFKPLGYGCYHSGKWHLSGAPRQVNDGGFDRSYTIDDHDRFFAPKKATLDEKPLPPVSEGSGFYLTTKIADYGIEFLKEHATQRAADPFLLYLAFTSPHFPLHALQEDIDRYRDKFLDGWDAARARHYERQRKMGIVDCALSPLDEKTIPDWNLPEDQLREKIGPGEAGHAVAWSELTETQKRFQATKMAIHAAMVDRMDREIGRVLDQLKAMGAYENTVILFASDNGASAEQIIRGDGNDPAAAPGSGKTFLCLGPGWSTASNTPFRLHKSWVHEGGISSPLIVHWPAGVKAKGELRHDPGHFTDLLPTMLDLAGAPKPEPTWNGAAAPPLPGRSLAPAFARDGAVEHEFIYFHHIQNRALRAGDWKLVSKGGQNGPDGPWELYNLKTDRCEMKNVAMDNPARVSELAATWERLEKQYREQAGPPIPIGGKKKGKAGAKKGKAKGKKAAE